MSETRPVVQQLLEDGEVGMHDVVLRDEAHLADTGRRTSGVGERKAHEEGGEAHECDAVRRRPPGS